MCNREGSGAGLMILTRIEGKVDLTPIRKAGDVAATLAQHGECDEARALLEGAIEYLDLARDELAEEVQPSGS